MKRILAFLLLSLTSFYCTSVYAAAQKKTAVYVQGHLTELQYNIVSSSVIERLYDNPKFKLFERNEDFLGAIINEQDFELSGDVAPEEIREIGKKLGVDYVIVVRVSFDEDRIYMTGRLLNIETGEILKSIALDRKGTDNKILKNLALTLSYKLLQSK